MSRSGSELEACEWPEPLMSTMVPEASPGTLEGRRPTSAVKGEAKGAVRELAFTTRTGSARCKTVSTLQLSHQLHKIHFIGIVTVLTQTTS